MLLASLLGNLLTGKRILRACSGINKEKGLLRAVSRNKQEKGILRADTGKECDF